MEAAVEVEPPSGAECPLTLDIMVDPVVCADGHTYEREAIEQWLGTSDVSPKTNEPLAHKHLVPNYALRSMILDWQQAHQQPVPSTATAQPQNPTPTTAAPLPGAGVVVPRAPQPQPHFPAAAVVHIGAPAVQGSAAADDSWICPTCTLLNNALWPKCDVCQTPRAGFVVAQQSAAAGAVRLLTPDDGEEYYAVYGVVSRIGLPGQPDAPLFISGMFDSDQEPLDLCEYGAIVKCTDRDYDPRHNVQPGAVRLELPFADRREAWPDWNSSLAAAHNCLQEHLQAGERCLVHCTNGKSRSAAVMITFVAKTAGLSYEEAKEFVERGRPIVACRFAIEIQDYVLTLQSK